jgi:hypothetical protein
MSGSRVRAIGRKRTTRAASYHNEGGFFYLAEFVWPWPGTLLRYAANVDHSGHGRGLEWVPTDAARAKESATRRFGAGTLDVAVCGAVQTSSEPDFSAAGCHGPNENLSLTWVDRDGEVASWSVQTEADLYVPRFSDYEAVVRPATGLDRDTASIVAGYMSFSIDHRASREILHFCFSTPLQFVRSWPRFLQAEGIPVFDLRDEEVKSVKDDFPNCVDELLMFDARPQCWMFVFTINSTAAIVGGCRFGVFFAASDKICAWDQWNTRMYLANSLDAISNSLTDALRSRLRRWTDQNPTPHTVQSQPRTLEHSPNRIYRHFDGALSFSGLFG